MPKIELPWPWWLSSLFDLAVLVAAVLVFRWSDRARIRVLAAAVAAAAVVAAIMAPLVMEDMDDDEPMPMMP